jgi:hypothetical protein
MQGACQKYRLNIYKVKTIGYKRSRGNRDRGGLSSAGKKPKDLVKMKKIIKENRFGRHFDNCRTSAGLVNPDASLFESGTGAKKKKSKGCMDFR